jgi:hypothetical protein
MYADYRFQVSAQPPAKKTAGQIEKETDERRTSNVQHRTSNECILSVLKKIWRCVSILHDSTRLSSSQAAVRYSIFDTAELVAGCGSLFSPAAGCQSGQFNQQKLHFCNK